VIGPLARTVRAAALMLVVAIAIAVSPVPGICFPWSIDMFRGDAVQPMAEMPRVMPSGTLPRGVFQPKSELPNMVDSAFIGQNRGR